MSAAKQAYHLAVYENAVSSTVRTTRRLFRRGLEFVADMIHFAMIEMWLFICLYVLRPCTYVREAYPVWAVLVETISATVAIYKTIKR